MGAFDNLRPIDKQLYRYASKDAGQSQSEANINMIGDYSSSAQDFIIKPVNTEVFAVHRLVVSVRDTGAFNADDYGVNIELTNGIKVFVESNGVKTYLNVRPIIANVDWGHVCYDVAHHAYGVGLGDEFLLVRWTFAKGGSPIWLRESNAEKIGFELNDDFSGLVEHKAFFHGQIYSTLE